MLINKLFSKVYLNISKLFPSNINLFAYALSNPISVATLSAKKEKVMGLLNSPSFTLISKTKKAEMRLVMSKKN